MKNKLVTPMGEITILVDDVEINKTDAKKSPAPSLEMPLKRQ